MKTNKKEIGKKKRICSPSIVVDAGFWPVYTYRSSSFKSAYIPTSAHTHRAPPRAENIFALVQVDNPHSGLWRNRTHPNDDEHTAVAFFLAYVVKGRYMSRLGNHAEKVRKKTWIRRMTFHSSHGRAGLKSTSQRGRTKSNLGRILLLRKKSLRSTEVWFYR
jgi:hypothetical protein